MIHRAYGILLLVVTWFIWSAWEQPAKWSPGMSLVLFLVGCVVPVLGLAFIVGGKRFDSWCREVQDRNNVGTVPVMSATTTFQLEAEEAYEMRKAIESTIRRTERELQEGGLLPNGTGHGELAERGRHSIDVLNGVLKKIPE